MVDLITNPPSGWNKWISASTIINGAEGPIYIPDADFPSLYTPADAFWVRSVLSHCIIPWINVVDPFTAFLMAGGSSGSIIGSIGGLAVVASLQEIFTAGGSFGLFPKREGGVGPKMGYNIGTSFKQQIYVRFDIQNAYGRLALTGTGPVVELMENSRFKRLYLYEGEVTGYTVEGVDGTDDLLSIDVEKFSDASTDISGSIRIAKSDGTSIGPLNIIGTTPDGNLIIQHIELETLPEAGDYYRMDELWVLEDPSLLGGFLSGTENQREGTISSGMDLFVSGQNVPYQEGKFLGAYFWTEKSSDTTSDADDTADSLYTQPMAGYSMNDTTTHTWAFIGFENSRNESVTYSNDIRYKENILSEPDPNNNNSIVQYQERLSFGGSAYSNMISSSDIEYVRVEINTGGYFNRNNWQAPALKGSYIEVDGYLFKIIDQVGFNIIDVSFKSIGGKREFDPGNYQDYSIVNQSAWMINENYMQNIVDGSTNGVFEGNVISAGSDSDGASTVIVLVDGDPEVLRGVKGNYSFIERYKEGVAIPSGQIQAFNRFQDWRLISDSKEAIADDSRSVSFSEPEFDGGPYEMTFPTKMNNGIENGDRVYVAFDTPYETRGNWTRKGIGITLEVNQALTSSASNLSYLTSNVLCLDGAYLSAPYVVDIPINTRYGVDDGFYFGLEANGTALRSDAQMSFLSTPRSSRGVASLFHTMRQEDWVIYEDPTSSKITIRRGSTDFTEYPYKTLISIGKDSLTESVEGSPIVLNEDQEYLKRIQVSPQENDNSGNPSLLFGIGAPDNTYGFSISGEGVVDLGMLQKQGIEAGDTSSGEWTNDGNDVSPVYIYQKDYYAQMDSQHIDIGITPDQGPIYVVGGTVTDVVAQYVQENQLLSNLDYFDAIRKSDGETILIYGQEASDFTIDGVQVNASKWNDQNAIFIIGTYDDNFIWSAPTAYRIDGDEKNENALMVLNSVDYLSSIYNPFNETILIFCRCYQGDVFYIGCFIVPTHNLLNDESVFPCDPVSDEVRPFSWRSPNLSDSNKSWTDSDNFINDGYSYDTSTSTAPEDNFIRVMGASGTDSQVSMPSEFGVISTSVLPNGTYVLFYDSEAGVRSIFSIDGGYTWNSSGIIWGRNGRSGIEVGGFFFYIGNSGIIAIETDYAHFYIASDLAAGISTPGAEEDLQKSLGLLDNVLLDSGTIEPQRLSGYVSSNGTIKIFFYDQNQLLKCIESTSQGSGWQVARNF